MGNSMYCSHCGNETSYQTLDSKNKLLFSNESYENYEHTLLLKCDHCEEYSIRVIDDDYKDAIEDVEMGIYLTVDDWFQVYPSVHLVDRSIPDEIRDLVTKSRIKLRRSPDMYFISIRKVLEKILSLHGYEEGTLNYRIGEIAKAREWPSDIQEMAHYIRKIGNLKAHEFKSENTEGLNTMVDLTNYCIDKLLDYLYISKPRIDQIKKFNTKI